MESWPWWVGLGWFVGYELWAVLTGHTTLSRMVWNATKKKKWLPWVAVTIGALLVAHFWLGLWGPAPLPEVAHPWPYDVQVPFIDAIDY